MAGLTVKIETNIIDWLMQKIEGENPSSSIFEILNQWKSGEKKPTFNQVKELSKKTNIPLGYFFLETPPIEECKVVEYRTVDSLNAQNLSRNLIDTVDHMLNIQEWMRNYLIENGYGQLEFVGLGNGLDNPMIIANSIRKILGLDIEWYKESKSIDESYKRLRSTSEKSGILVMMNGIVGSNTHRPLNIREFRAFTLIDNYAPLIFINTNDTDGGKVFSLLHEVAHIWLGVNDFYNDQYGIASKVNTTEKICNAVAAEILVPHDIFIELWNQSNVEHINKIEEIAKIFKCSRSVVARRALDMKFITNVQYSIIIEECITQYEIWIEGKKTKKSSGGNYYSTMASRIDPRFMNALASSAREGRTQYTEVYRLTNTNRTTFDKLINRGGGVLW